MQAQADSVQVRDVAFARVKTESRFEGIVFTGPGREVIERISRETSQSGAAVLDSIVHRLLVKKGADWTCPILSEYMGLYNDSLGTFSLVWDKTSRQLAAHGSVFQSRKHPGAGLVAHIRTDDAFRGFGLGSLVTEEVTAASLRQGSQVVVLGTDDKRHRIQQGEKAAYSMYAKLGYAILAEKELTDTIEWLMVVDQNLLQRCNQEKQAGGGRFPEKTPPEILDMYRGLVESVREKFSQRLTDGQTSPVTEGDMANLFLLMNLCPADDFRVKLVPWGVQLGPEMERCYLVSVRPAIVDCDRMEVASLALRDSHGSITAVCAAQRVFPFTRNAMRIDFYCLPRFLAANRPAVAALVEGVVAKIAESAERPSPCRLLFSGVDAEKIALFESLGFLPTPNTLPYFTAEGAPAFTAREWEKTL
jgi:hypothetical protein